MGLAKATAARARKANCKINTKLVLELLYFSVEHSVGLKLTSYKSAFLLSFPKASPKGVYMNLILSGFCPKLHVKSADLRDVGWYKLEGASVFPTRPNKAGVLAQM